jgi:hypothetical protein
MLTCSALCLEDTRTLACSKSSLSALFGCCLPAGSCTDRARVPLLLALQSAAAHTHVQVTDNQFLSLGGNPESPASVVSPAAKRINLVAPEPATWNMNNLHVSV